MRYFAAFAVMLAAGVPAAGQTLDIEEFESGFSRLVYLTHAGDGSGRVFFLERGGVILVSGGALQQRETFMDISGRVTVTTSSFDERGLLGLAFHPDFESNGIFYVNYTATENTQLITRISAFEIDEQNANRGDASSEVVLLDYDQPASNHNAGWLGFGPDGYLYIPTGDGGSGGDPWGEGGNAQNLNTFLGKVLRLDVAALTSYAIPPDNPYAGKGGALPEIWAYGLRNPWRPSFDRETGDLYLADVGQSQIEEVSFQSAASDGGENYGWRVLEGNDCFDDSEAGGNPPCNDSGFTDPIHTYNHTGGRCSITGGYVYRGELMPRARGLYFFADYCSHNVYSFQYIDGVGKLFFTDRTSELDPSVNVTSFGEDEAGELYILTFNTAYRIFDPAARAARENILPDFADATGGDNAATLQELQDAGITIDQASFDELDADDDGAVSLPELLNVSGVGGVHHADTDISGAIELDELLRVIQLYNADGYTCDDGEGAPTEDGFILGEDPLNCTRHTADYLAPIGEITLSEVLRMIQYFNSAGIAYCPESGSDDLFCPQVS